MRLLLSTVIIAATLVVAAFMTPISKASAQETIKIGAPLPLTGALADEGKKQELVWDMWVSKVNAAGGLRVDGKKMEVRLVKYDYQSDGQRAGQLTEKLITSDNVDAILAPFGSGHTKIVAIVAERYRVPVVACASSAETVFNQGLHYLFGTLSPNATMTDTMVTFFRQSMPNIKKLAVLGRDDVFPKSMAEGIVASAKKQGLDIVYDERYAVGTLDHSAALTAIRAAKPDWIYVTGYTQDLILARKQMHDLGVTAPIVTMVTGPAYAEFVDGLSDLANGVTSSSWWYHTAAYSGIGVWPTTADFDSEFKAKTGRDPDYVNASCAAALVVLGNAIEHAGTLDKEKLRDGLAATDLKTFYGPVRFSTNGMNQVRDLPIIQVQNGTVDVLYPEDIRNAKLIPMPH
jgi:branched-chain amino acid transport system substrate-binding protein